MAARCPAGGNSARGEGGNLANSVLGRRGVRGGAGRVCAVPSPALAGRPGRVWRGEGIGIGIGWLLAGFGLLRRGSWQGLFASELARAVGGKRTDDALAPGQRGEERLNGLAQEAEAVGEDEDEGEAQRPAEAPARGLVLAERLSVRVVEHAEGKSGGRAGEIGFAFTELGCGVKMRQLLVKVDLILATCARQNNDIERTESTRMPSGI